MMIISKISVTNLVYLIILLTLTFKFYLYALNHVVGISDAVTHANKHRGNLTKTKYGLFWVRYKNPLPMIKQFKTANCIVSDCVFTDLKSYFYDYSDFDAIIFDDICVFNKTRRPKNRKSHQLYIFSSQEAPNTIPACEVFNDGFYNWSFTYRLDSEVHWSYFIVRNATRHVVAPSTSVQWPVIHSDPKEIPSHVLDLINGRTRAAAWLVSHCGASSQRDIYLSSLKEHLASYSLELDVYGNCSGIPCDDNRCDTMLKKKYFFYMSFENSFSPDYVTEKVMHGYKNYVVPIVYGGANYSRFLPPNTYIDARLHHPYNLAKIIHDSINDRAKYLKYFSWINHYTFEQEPEYNPLCEMCEALHSERAKSAPVMKKFRLWWNQGSAWKWCLPEEFWKDSLKAALDPTHLFHYTNY